MSIESIESIENSESITETKSKKKIKDEDQKFDESLEGIFKEKLKKK